MSPHALKGQKLLAQGNALGIKAINKAPCKGKSLMFTLEFFKLLPFQGVWGLLAKLQLPYTIGRLIPLIF